MARTGDILQWPLHYAQDGCRLLLLIQLLSARRCEQQVRAQFSYVCVYVCAYVRMYACMYVCVYVFIYFLIMHLILTYLTKPIAAKGRMTLNNESERFGTGVSNFSGMGGEVPQQLLWARSRIAPLKITLSGIPNRSSHSVIFIAHINFTNLAAGR
jgi:hypothetical protein